VILAHVYRHEVAFLWQTTGGNRRRSV
jgi:hypothetical protein